MQPKTSIELGINKAISTDLQLCLDLAQKHNFFLKIIALKACTHIVDQNNMNKLRL